ncbi:MAG: CDP-alcohol phosphatidyltransferase [Pseudonocardiales bacterium]|nr:MAG: CDP-alcohol phosphatidyltransferase [Pseudonocardiales bacterium]
MVTDPTVAGRPRFSQVLARLAPAQKSSRGAAGYTRWINRRLGRYIAAAAYLRGLAPNHLSAANATLTVAAMTVIATVSPSWPMSAMAAFLLLFGYAFDSADGQLARLKGGGSPAGEWLDHELDALKCTAIHCVIAIAWFRFYDLENPSLLLIPLAYSVVNSGFFFGVMLAEQLRRVARANALAEPGHDMFVPAAPSVSDPAPVLRSLIVLPNDYGVLCLALALLPSAVVFITVYSFLLVANALFLLVGSLRWYREMARLGRAAQPEAPR